MEREHNSNGCIVSPSQIIMGRSAQSSKPVDRQHSMNTLCNKQFDTHSKYRLICNKCCIPFLMLSSGWLLSSQKERKKVAIYIGFLFQMLTANMTTWLCRCILFAIEFGHRVFILWSSVLGGKNHRKKWKINQTRAIKASRSEQIISYSFSNVFSWEKKYIERVGCKESLQVKIC